MTSSVTIEWWGEELSAAILLEHTNGLPGDTVESLLQRTHQAFDKNRIESPAPVVAVTGAQSPPAR